MRTGSRIPSSTQHQGSRLVSSRSEPSLRRDRSLRPRVRKILGNSITSDANDRGALHIGTGGTGSPKLSGSNSTPAIGPQSPSTATGVACQQQLQPRVMKSRDARTVRITPAAPLAHDSAEQLGRQCAPAALVPKTVDASTGHLQEISSVASRILSDMSLVRKQLAGTSSSDALLHTDVSSAQGDYVDDIMALREISSVTQKVVKDLSYTRKDQLRSMPETMQTAARGAVDLRYGDPALETARSITMLTKELCQTRLLPEYAMRPPSALDPLQEISTATQKVCADMSNLLHHGWALDVLATMNEDSQDGALSVARAEPEVPSPKAGKLGRKSTLKSSGQGRLLGRGTVQFAYEEEEPEQERCESSAQGLATESPAIVASAPHEKAMRESLKSGIYADAVEKALQRNPDYALLSDSDQEDAAGTEDVRTSPKPEDVRNSLKAGIYADALERALLSGSEEEDVMEKEEEDALRFKKDEGEEEVADEEEEEEEESDSDDGVMPVMSMRSMRSLRSFSEGNDSVTTELPSPSSPAPRKSMYCHPLTKGERVAQLRSAHRETVQEGQAIAEQLQRTESEGLDKNQAVLCRNAFNRFKVPDTAEVHKDSLPGLLTYLGHVWTDRDEIASMLREVTDFDYLDFDEFLEFLQKYFRSEREHFHRIFNQFDANDSGLIALKNLRQLLSEVGFIPMQATTREALETVNVKDDGTHGVLKFEQLVVILAIYRRGEGFTKAEKAELQHIFNTLAMPGVGSADQGLPISSLSHSMVHFFGMQLEDIAKRIQDQEISNSKRNSYGRNALAFPEFLIIARKVREAAFERLRLDYEGRHGVFHVLAKGHDGHGSVTDLELREIVRALGYMPLGPNVEEWCKEVRPKAAEAWTVHCQLDFNQLFDLALIVYKRDGFLRTELKDMRPVFDRFCREDKVEEMHALELSKCFRALGLSAALDEMHKLVLEVDVNGNNTLDYREFLRVMRLHREKVLKKFREVFDVCSGTGSGGIRRHMYEEALGALGHDREDCVALARLTTDPFLDFDGFVHFADSVRDAVLTKERKKAGFSKAEIADFRVMFCTFDTDGSGDISTMELLKILKEFGWEPKTREEQKGLIKKLDTAREAARAAGVSDVGQDGSSQLKFWAFVQLVRILQNEYDKADEDNLVIWSTELNFSHHEVEEFRQIFNSWHEREVGRVATLTSSVNLSMLVLSKETIKRLVRSLGLSIEPDMMRCLDDKLASLEACPGNRQKCIDFHSFLILMRWLLDTDFAGASHLSPKSSR